MNKALVSLKRQLRKDMAVKLEQITATELNRQSEQVFQKLQQLDQFKQSKNVSVYISMPTCEIITNSIIQYILQSDKACYIPRCTKTTMDMVRITSIEDFNSLPKNKWNIPEPPLDQPRENALDKDGLDLILVPGVAFDQEKNRIGHGKGYYDRYIRKCNTWAAEHGKNAPQTVALALNEQMVDLNIIPLEETDQKLNAILTAEKTIC
ncbi:5-formyltetrahydrofolate cyclo-ligase [Backusella circina FSU 941]|nr:5-formyltetrahydrofolate cyclo-ligase [Backusella circina FSU 941]